MIKYEGLNALEFYAEFSEAIKFKEYLAKIKWFEGYKCIKCGHNAAQVRKDYSRTCNTCSHIESATANTLFHKVKFGLHKAFIICFAMTTTTKSLSAKYMAERVGVTEYTAKMSMHKVRTSMSPSKTAHMIGRVEVDEFVVGGTEEGKVGRSYASKKKKPSQH